MRRLLYAGAAIVFALALVAWAVVNRAPVTIAFPMTDWALLLPLHLVFFAGLVFGVFLAGIVTLLPRLRGRLRRRRLEKRVKAAESRVGDLEARTPPETGPRLAAIDRAQDAGGGSQLQRSA